MDFRIRTYNWEGKGPIFEDRQNRPVGRMPPYLMSSAISFNDVVFDNILLKFVFLILALRLTDQYVS